MTYSERVTTRIAVQEGAPMKPIPKPLAVVLALSLVVAGCSSRPAPIVGAELVGPPAPGPTPPPFVTGEVRGVVRDTAGSLLPGVSVEIKGPALLGTRVVV